MHEKNSTFVKSIQNLTEVLSLLKSIRNLTEVLSSLKSIQNLTEVEETEKFMDAEMCEFGKRSF